MLANDTDPDTDAFSVSSIVQPANGVATAQPNGTITYAPNANFFGSDSFTYRALDARGGLSLPATVSVTVTAVNDPPSFTKGPDQAVDMNSGQRTVPNWATNISAGPLETTQTVTFVVSNDNNSLFSAQPTVSSTGTLTFTPGAGVAGTALVTLHLMDTGGKIPASMSARRRVSSSPSMPLLLQRSSSPTRTTQAAAHSPSVAECQRDDVR